MPRRLQSALRDHVVVRIDEASVFWVDEEALDEGHLPLLPAQPALGLVEEPLDLVVLAGDARHRQARALPHVVVVDLGDRRADAVLQLRLRRAP